MAVLLQYAFYAGVIHRFTRCIIATFGDVIPTTFVFTFFIKISLFPTFLVSVSFFHLLHSSYAVFVRISLRLLIFATSIHSGRYIEEFLIFFSFQRRLYGVLDDVCSLHRTHLFYHVAWTDTSHFDIVACIWSIMGAQFMGSPSLPSTRPFYIDSSTVLGVISSFVWPSSMNFLN